MSENYTIIKGPWVTEKSTLMNEYNNQVVFEVDPRANKIEIKKAVEQIFKVKVMSVRTMWVKGKPKRLGRSFGYRSKRKKAIVRLEPGHKIEFFEGV